MLRRNSLPHLAVNRTISMLVRLKLFAEARSTFRLSDSLQLDSLDTWLCARLVDFSPRYVCPISECEFLTMYKASLVNHMLGCHELGKLPFVSMSWRSLHVALMYYALVSTSLSVHRRVIHCRDRHGMLVCCCTVSLCCPFWVSYMVWTEA